MKCLNTPTCWRKEGPFRVIYKSKKEWIVGNGVVEQTPTLFDDGQIRFIVALNGLGKGDEKTVKIQEYFIAKILDGHNQPFWTNRDNEVET